MTSAITFVSEATAEHGAELPFPAPYFGAIALVIFLLLLGITWSFRNTAAKYGQRGEHTGPTHPESSAAHEPGAVL